jgi:hypothetical protein
MLERPLVKDDGLTRMIAVKAFAHPTTPWCIDQNDCKGRCAKGLNDSRPVAQMLVQIHKGYHCSCSCCSVDKHKSNNKDKDNRNFNFSHSKNTETG